MRFRLPRLPRLLVGGRSAAASLLLAALPLLAGCATGNGSFKADGFHHAEYPYVVHYGDSASREFLGPDWRIDNYVLSEDGKPLTAKDSSAYHGPLEIDIDGSGKPVHETVYYFDLKLANKKSSAVIWVQTVPLGPDRAERNLRVLMDGYVAGISGTGFYSTSRQADDDTEDKREVRAKTFAAKVIDAKETKVGGLDAFDATIELANLDQLKLDPNHRASVARVILVRTDYYKDWFSDPAHPAHTRALLRIGYEAHPQDFEAGLPDFAKFLTLLELPPPKK